MQRLFKVPIRPLSSPRFALLSLPPLLRTLSARTTNAPVTSPAKCHSRVHRRRKDLERRVFRGTKGNVSRRSGLIIRFRGAERETIVSARGET